VRKRKHKRKQPKSTLRRVPTKTRKWEMVRHVSVLAVVLRDLKDARAFALQARKVRRKRARRNAKVAAESASAGDETEVEIATGT
jgi:hypothetical protein